MDDFGKLMAMMAAMLGGQERETNLEIRITDAKTGQPVILLNAPHEGQSLYWATDCNNPHCGDKEGCRRRALVRNFDYIESRVDRATVVERPEDVGLSLAPLEAGPVDPNYFGLADVVGDLGDLWKEDKDGR